MEERESLRAGAAGVSVGTAAAASAAAAAVSELVVRILDRSVSCKPADSRSPFVSFVFRGVVVVVAAVAVGVSIVLNVFSVLRWGIRRTRPSPLADPATSSGGLFHLAYFLRANSSFTEVCVSFLLSLELLEPRLVPIPSPPPPPPAPAAAKSSVSGSVVLLLSSSASSCLSGLV